MWYSSVIINIYYEGISWHNLWRLWISIILSIYEYLNKKKTLREALFMPKTKKNEFVTLPKMNYTSGPEGVYGFSSGFTHVFVLAKPWVYYS